MQITNCKQEGINLSQCWGAPLTLHQMLPWTPMMMVVVVKLNMMMTTVKIFLSGKDQTARSSDGPSDVPDLSVCHTSRHSHGHRHWFLLVAIVICLPIFV